MRHLAFQNKAIIKNLTFTNNINKNHPLIKGIFERFIIEVKQGGDGSDISGKRGQEILSIWKKSGNFC